MTSTKKKPKSKKPALTQSRYHAGVTGSSLGRTRNLNRRVVLETIRTHGPLERVAIVERTKLATQTVSNIVNTLLEEGLIEKCDPVSGRLGSPAHPLAIRPNGAFSIGLTLDKRSVLGCSANLAGEIVAMEEHSIRDMDGIEACALISDMVGRLRRATGNKNDRFLGIGMGVSGPFGVQSYLLGGPTSTPFWLTNEAIDDISETTGLPIDLTNDNLTSTIGERLYGVAKDMRSFVYLFVGYGTAAGYVLDDRVYCGTDGNAGEIGHTMLMPGGHSCFCGNSGCLEQYLSLFSVRKHLGIDVFDAEVMSAFCRTLSDPGPKTKVWLNDAAEAFRRAVHFLEQLFDPDCIVIGGYMPRPILEEVIRRAEPYYASVRKREGDALPRVIIGATGREVGVLSAAALPLYSQMNPALDIVL